MNSQNLKNPTKSRMSDQAQSEPPASLSLPSSSVPVHISPAIINLPHIPPGTGQDLPVIPSEVPSALITQTSSSTAPATSTHPAGPIPAPAGLQANPNKLTHAQLSMLSYRRRAGRKPGGAPKQPARELATRKNPRSWTRIKNAEGKSELDLIFGWLTVKSHFQLWRTSGTSKRKICEEILAHLALNGFPNHGREWRGVEQQISRMEGKCRDAISWRDEMGHEIMSEAQQLQRNQADQAHTSDAENYVEIARKKTEAELRRICPYFFELMAAMGYPHTEATTLAATVPELGGDRPASVIEGDPQEGQGSATPSESSLSRCRSPEADDGHITELSPSSSTQGAIRQTAMQITRASPQQSALQSFQHPSFPSTSNPLGNAPVSLAQSSIFQNASQTVQSLSPRKRRTYTERIDGQSLPSNKDSVTDRTVNNDEATQRLLMSSEQMTQVASKLVMMISKKDEPRGAGSDPDLIRLQIRERELEVQMREIEVEKARSEAEQRRAEFHRQQSQTGAFERARMMQDFLKAGLDYEKALRATLQFLGPPTHSSQ